MFLLFVPLTILYVLVIYTLVYYSHTDRVNDMHNGLLLFSECLILKHNNIFIITLFFWFNLDV